VHIVGATAVVTRVLPQVEELLDVEVPGLEIRANGPLALAALIDGDGRVVDDLEEGNDPLALAVGALDDRAGRADVRPVVAETASPLRELRIVADALEDVVEVVADGRQIATR